MWKHSCRKISPTTSPSALQATRQQSKPPSVEMPLQSTTSRLIPWLPCISTYINNCIQDLWKRGSGTGRLSFYLQLSKDVVKTCHDMSSLQPSPIPLQLQLCGRLHSRDQRSSSQFAQPGWTLSFSQKILQNTEAKAGAESYGRGSLAQQLNAGFKQKPLHNNFHIL